MSITVGIIINRTLTDYDERDDQPDGRKHDSGRSVRKFRANRVRCFDCPIERALQTSEYHNGANYDRNCSQGKAAETDSVDVFEMQFVRPQTTIPQRIIKFSWHEWNYRPNLHRREATV